MPRRSVDTPRNVFVLSGGGARGAAQVGMLRTLAEAGVSPHALVGTSVGALNGAYVAQYPGPDRIGDLEDYWRRLTTSDVFPGNRITAASNLLRRRPYLYPATGVQRIVRDWLPGIERLEGLATPLRVVTTKLGSGRPEYHDTGDLEPVLLASTALPALFPPVYLPDPEAGQPTPHVDGGVADNIPVAGALGLNATHVYVLDATVAPHMERPKSALDVLVQCFAVSIRLRGQVDFGHGVTVTHIRGADEVETGLTDFTNTDRLVDAGRRLAEEALATEPVEVPAGRVRFRRRRLQASSRTR